MIVFVASYAIAADVLVQPVLHEIKKPAAVLPGITTDDGTFRVKKPPFGIVLIVTKLNV